MTTKDLLAERGLTTAVIIDDAYDEIPRAEDLALDEEAWQNFFDDVGEDAGHLRQAFPKYDQMSAQQLRESSAFVAAAWGLRNTLRPELWVKLFEAYELATRSDRETLQKLEAGLAALGIETTRVGRDPPGPNTAGIVFVDLFLGAAQTDPDMIRSLQVLDRLLAARRANPPLVILMSRSGSLADKRGEFRDKAKLIGAMFRVCTKPDLIGAGALERLLERLARHHIDAMKVASFIHAWEGGLQNAADRFLEGMRRLDLTDYAQIREVLLNFEGQPLGSYVLDVFDRVLQHEIEGHDDTIKAAEGLNTIRADQYPPPHVAGSTDLQKLVYRSIWQHPKRLAVKTTTEAEVPVGFGDVLVRRDICTGAAPPQDHDADVFVVLSGACDLARPSKLTRVLVLAGTCNQLLPSAWTYSEGARTPIVILPTVDERRGCINWNLKDVRMLSLAEVSGMLAPNGQYSVTLRMREGNALELQQKLFAKLSRVGLVAQMPATFSVELSAYRAGPDGNLARIELPAGIRDGGVCYIGRDAKGDETTRLVLTEDVIDELVEAVGKLKDEDVHQRAQETLKRLKASTTLAACLERGIKAPNSNQTAYIDLKVASNADASQDETVGLIVRNAPEGSKPPQVKNAALVLSITDQNAEKEAAVAPGEPVVEQGQAPGR